MSVAWIESPVFRVACEQPGCPAALIVRDRGNEWAALAAARAEGWQTRPVRGKGSRTPAEWCPRHRTDAEGADHD